MILMMMMMKMKMMIKEQTIGQYTTPAYLSVTFSVSGFVVTFSASGKGDEVTGVINDSNSYSEGKTNQCLHSFLHGVKESCYVYLITQRLSH